MLPEPYLKTINDMRVHYHAIEQAINQKGMAEELSVRQQHERHETRVTQVTNKFLETGVFFLASSWEGIPKINRSHGQRSEMPLAVYCKELAQSLKRPFIRMIGDHTLLVPKRKKLDVLTVPFMFSARQVKSQYELNMAIYGKHHRNHFGTMENVLSAQGVFEIMEYESIRQYRFIGDEGKKFYEMWLEHIKSPECRKALGFS